MINKKIFLLLVLFASLFIISCDDDDDDLYGNWVYDFQFSGYKRCGAVCFTINDTVFFGMGYNGSRTSGGQYFKDMNGSSGSSYWASYDPFPGDGRQDAFAFAVDGKGYVGCGFYGDTLDIYYKDVWEFDPNAPSGSQWAQLDDFPGGVRTEATSFVVDGKAYVVGGVYEESNISHTFKDCYVFDSSTGTFTLINSMGYKRAGAFSFVIDNKVYVGGGYNDSYVRGFEVFDPETGVWNGGDINCPLRDLYLSDDIIEDIDHYDDPLDLRRRWAATFVIDGKGYIMGGNYSGVLSDCWEYNPSTDLWTEKNSFESSMMGRQRASAFILNGLPYIMAGYYSDSYYLDDAWYFEPDEDEDDDD